MIRYLHVYPLLYCFFRQGRTGLSYHKLVACSHSLNKSSTHVTKETNSKNRIEDYPLILFLNFHPKLLKISMTVISCWLHFVRMDHSSSLDRIDQDLIQCIALKITCIVELVVEFLKITSFRLSQMDQQRAEAPIKTVFLNCAGKLLHEPNRSATQVGG